MVVCIVGLTFLLGLIVIVAGLSSRPTKTYVQSREVVRPVRLLKDDEPKRGGSGIFGFVNIDNAYPQQQIDLACALNARNACDGKYAMAIDGGGNVKGNRCAAICVSPSFWGNNGGVGVCKCTI